MLAWNLTKHSYFPNQLYWFLSDSLLFFSFSNFPERDFTVDLKDDWIFEKIWANQYNFEKVVVQYLDPCAVSMAGLNSKISVYFNFACFLI